MSATGAPANLADMVRAQAKNRGNALAYEFEGRQTTFAEFDVKTNRVANALIAMGLKKTDRIAYLGKNSDIYFELLLGAMKAGVVMAPVNWRLAGPEVAFIVEDCKAPVLFTGPEFITQVKNIKAQLPGVKHVITTEGGAPEWLDFTAWRDAQSGDDPGVKIETKDVAMQLYTSGTTGKPKGAMLSHANFVNLVETGNEAEKPEWNRWSTEDVSLVAMPIFHIGGSGWGVVGLAHGAKGVIAREFDPTKVLDFFEQFGITKLFMVPAAMQFVVRQPRARTMDFSRLKYMLYGASPIPAALLKECIEVFKCGFVQRDRHSRRQMGRSGKSDRGDEAREARHRHRHHQFHPRTHRRLQDAEDSGLYRGAAAQSVRQDSAAESARPVLGRQGPAGELSRHCEHSEAIHLRLWRHGLLRRFAPRNDGGRRADFL
jgi:acyl-CoA synthetase (AMP-forming)/AMP-acid ligase II